MLMDSPSTPHQGRRARALEDEPDVLQEHPINLAIEQLEAVTISRPSAAERKREQTAPTPASQARPRIQRRTMAAATSVPSGQENSRPPAEEQQLRQAAATTPSSDNGQPESAGGAAAARSSAAQGFTPSRLSCISALRDELSCGICLEICVRPCATPCGHNFCRSCLRQALQHKRQCPHCREALPPNTRWQPKVNTGLWNTIQLLFPQHAAEAPPPTPPGQLPAAAAAEPVGSSRSQALHAAASGWLAARTGVTSGSASGAAEAAVQTRSRVHRMAEVLHGSRQGDWTSAAARQPFRPPRSNSASRWQSDAPRSRQQASDGPVLEPGLINMLRSMQGTRAGAQQQQQQQQQPSASLQQPAPRRSRVDPMVAAADAWHRQQGWQQQQQRSGQRRQQTQRQIDVIDLLEDASRGDVSQPATQHTSPDTRRLAGRSSTLPRRSGYSAAGATAHGEPWLFSSDDGDDYNEQEEAANLLLQEALLRSLIDGPTSSSTGAGNTSSNGRGANHHAAAAAAAGSRSAAPVVGSGASVQDRGLLIRIHSGSSPRHLWEEISDAQEPDWLLLDNNGSSQQQQQPGRQQQPTAGLPGPQPSGENSRQFTRTAPWIMARSAASLRQRLRPNGAAAAAVMPGGSGSSALDVEALLDNLEDDVGGPAGGYQPAAAQPMRGPDARAARAAADAGAAAQLTAPTQSRRVARAILDASDDESGSDTRPSSEQQQVSGAGDNSMPEAVAAPSMPSWGRASGRQGAVEAPGNRRPSHALGGMLVSGDVQGTSSSARPQARADLQESPAGECSMEQSPPAAALGPMDDGLDVLALTLADSPEPQPLRTRLARVANSKPAQQERRQQQAQARQDRQQMAVEQQQQGEHQPNPAASAAASSGRSSVEGSQQVTGTAQEPGARSSEALQQPADSDEDDFQPRAPRARTRLTAARASATIPSNRRIVAGMRPTTARRAAPSTSSR